MVEAGSIPVLGGFIGAGADGATTTLGRNGSDYTAALVGAALGAREIEIWTDTDGVLTADPRVVPNARLIHYIAYEEILELAAFGAKVMHPRAVEIGELYGVPIHVRSSFRKRPGTMIVAQVPMEERNRVRGVAHDTDAAKITILGVPDRPGIAAALFRAVSDEGVPVDMIVQNIAHDGRNDISFTAPKEEVSRLRPLMDRMVKEIGAEGHELDDGVAKVSLVGAGIKSNPGVAAHMFEALAEEGINIEMISTSSIRVSCVVRAGDAARAVRAVHARFRLAEETAAREEHRDP
jgi:aspartate kinase